jgi:hypothetical protein
MNQGVGKYQSMRALDVYEDITPSVLGIHPGTTRESTLEYLEGK